MNVEAMFEKLLNDPTIIETDKVEIRKGLDEARKKISQGIPEREILLDILTGLNKEISRRGLNPRVQDP